jgi:flagellar hook-associated protein 3 FlgL
MRITNQMMTNNMMYNINKNKNNLAALDEQYSTGKKIQRPSDDPIIAVRALKLRTNLTELNQYYEKNIPDAKSWMDVTESALTTVNDILTSINTYCVQGTTDTLTASDRTSIVQNLAELKEQVYQEGNSNYAGRYVFTGYKTDTSLTMDKDRTNLKYSITEVFTGEDLETISKVTGEYALSDYNAASPPAFPNAPTLTETHRIRLAYDNLKSMAAGSTLSFKVGGVAGTPLPITTVSSTSTAAYAPTAGTVNYIPETGELVFAEADYNALRLAEDIKVTYNKTEFAEGDLRPEHYFDCTLTDTDAAVPTPITFVKQDQQIQYEINFNQRLTINTQASDAFTHDIGRDIDEIVSAVQEVSATEDKITEVEKMLEDTSITDAQKESLNALLGQFNTELVLKNSILQSKFENSITGTADQQEEINVVVADLGSRYVRLELTESRLSSQQVDFEDLLSTNEDADIAETYIKLSAAEVIYNASLSAAAKVVQNTLLDFI